MHKITSLKEITKPGGVLPFLTEFIFEWAKDRYVSDEELNMISEYSLKFHSTKEGYHNSEIDIYGDMEYWSDATDEVLIALVLNKKPSLIFEYNDSNVYFFEYMSQSLGSLIISCESEDSAFWYVNVTLEEVSSLYERPKNIRIRK